MYKCKELLERMGKSLILGVELLYRQQMDKGFESLTAFTENLLNLEKEILGNYPGFWTPDNKNDVKDILKSIQGIMDWYIKGELPQMFDLAVYDLVPLYERLKHDLLNYNANFGESPGDTEAEVLVLLRIDNKKFLLLVIAGCELLIFKTWELDNNKYRETDYLLWKMLYENQKLFAACPLSKISFELIKPIKSNSDIVYIEKTYAFFAKCVISTNQHMQQYKYLRNLADSYNKALFYYFENDTRFNSIYKECLNQYPNQVVLKEIPSGWDYLKRRWESSPDFGTVEALVAMIQTQNIQQLIVVNYYIYEIFLSNYSVFLPPLLNMLGVKAHGVDYDPVDLEAVGPLKRAAINPWEERRFSFAPSLFEPWDEAYKNPNVFYTPVIQHYSNQTRTINLDKNYDVIVLSHARLDHFNKKNLPLILYLLQEMEEDIPFTEHELWYYAMCRLVKKKIGDDELSKLKVLSFLFSLIYKIANFLKYEVINSIETKREIKIFGDEAWGLIFPEYYKNRYLTQSEVAALYKEQNHLYLLLNNCFSYIEAGGPVYDAVKNNLPFINYQALVRTPYFEGFKHIEYANREELNHLINNATSIYTEPKLMEARVRHNNLMHEGEKDFINSLFESGFKPESGGAMQKQWGGHRVILDALIDEYSNKRKEFLQQCFDIILFKQDFNIVRSRCPYLDRPYVKNIWKLNDNC